MIDLFFPHHKPASNKALTDIRGSAGNTTSAISRHSFFRTCFRNNYKRYKVRALSRITFCLQPDKAYFTLYNSLGESKQSYI
jgi:hypothetical protein